MNDPFMVVVYIDHVVKVLAFILIILMIVVGIKQYRNETRRKKILNQLLEQSSGIEKLLGRPWKDVKNFLKDDK